MEDVFSVRTGTQPGSMFPQGRYWTRGRVLLPSVVSAEGQATEIQQAALPTDD